MILKFEEIFNDIDHQINDDTHLHPDIIATWQELGPF